MAIANLKAETFAEGTFVGRVFRPEVGGPAVVVLRDGQVYDITDSQVPTMRDLLELPSPASVAQAKAGEHIGALEEIGKNSSAEASDKTHLLSPFDLQAVKACGVTFAQSMIERVIEERAAGNPDKAAEVRAKVQDMIGGSITDLVAGSPEAEKAKSELIKAGMWSQYLEVGIGPDAEVFTKGQVLSPVGWGARVGLHPISKWNNPEPEIVLAVNSRGETVGATLGNDVNLRDVEGRSALLLGKAKDNNASCSIGPFIRLFDDSYSLDDVRKAELTLTVSGEDGFELNGFSSMSAISRDPADLVRQTIGAHHQYPDGLSLFLGTLFAPTQDRDAEGQGFTHKLGDIVNISCDGLGTLSNVVDLSTNCPQWTFGVRDLMSNLSSRNLI